MSPPSPSIVSLNKIFKNEKCCLHVIYFDLVDYLFSAHDFTFSRQIHGEHVPYGEAGDCYSAANCPQVRLSWQAFVLNGLPEEEHCLICSDKLFEFCNYLKYLLSLPAFNNIVIAQLAFCYF
jgi:hypothetical protein